MINTTDRMLRMLQRILQRIWYDHHDRDRYWFDWWHWFDYCDDSSTTILLAADAVSITTDDRFCRFCYCFFCCDNVLIFFYNDATTMQQIDTRLCMFLYFPPKKRTCRTKFWNRFLIVFDSVLWNGIVALFLYIHICLLLLFLI